MAVLMSGRGNRGRQAVRALLLVGLATLLLGADSGFLADADRIWAERARGERDGRPDFEVAMAAVRAYEEAIAARPGNLEARWKLLRAIHFAGDFADPSMDEKRRLFERGRKAAESGLSSLADRVGSGVRLDDMEPESIAGLLAAKDIPASDVARLHFWSAANWGAWSRTVGLLSAVQQGVANRLHRYTLIAIALEPDYEEGGPLRLLGRLHAELPRVPFVTGWIDPDRSIPLVEQAVAIAPRNPGNRLLLALSILDLAPARRDEAIGLLEEVGQLTPRPTWYIEDLAVRRLARERLAEDADRGKM